MQHYTLGMTNFLRRQKFFHIRSLIPAQLNDFSRVFIILNGSVARKRLFECLANTFDVKIIRQSSDCGNTFASVPLLNTDVDFFFRRDAALVSGVFKRVCGVFV